MLKGYRLVQLLSLMIIVSFASQFPIAQSNTNKSDNNTEQNSLDGRTEAVLIDGQPALRVLSRKGSSTEIRFQKRDQDDALVFNVSKWAVGFPPGKLYITKTKLIFVPINKNKSFFNFEKTKIKEVEHKKMLGGQHFIKIQKHQTLLVFIFPKQFL